MNTSFEKKVALVTGAGSGMGLATAQAFAEAGASVVLADRHAESVRASSRPMRSDRASVLTWRSLYPAPGDRSPHLGWCSRRDTRVAIHPSISDSSQPTAFVVSLRLEGNCPRHSRRQSVVRDSPVRAQTSRHRRKRAGERPTCAGWSDASVPSWLSRALLTSADATRWRLKIATCVHCGERFARVTETAPTH
jgi:hypothetical protein